ncbi:hypothetical protein O5O45_18985 [Hahella aquimaris]|uniref:hypothetical protein n=1 Tax=Hahella sp. HNIBRBA332 TaxID=3015983 RepID=UPI00273BE424|nr:hypothetical protein [Hahella sp. HNIBRBA332]WLQ11816.1 hypothetical protein O5O45_18985 [Hahella sp. HNIBRBA332]
MKSLLTLILALCAVVSGAQAATVDNQFDITIPGFVEMDKDADALITRFEARNRQDLIEAFEMFDMDRSGDISLVEYADFMSSAHNKSAFVKRNATPEISS